MTARNQRVYCVINPARRHHATVLRLVQEHCAALGFPPPTLLHTTIEHPGGAQAQEALSAGADLVIVAGGDGTVGNVGNVLAHTGVAMGIVPIGTANIFHLNVIGKGKKIDRSVRTALMGDDLPVDTGAIRLHTADDQHLDGRFLVVVGVGRDALTLTNVSQNLKHRIGPAAYFLAGVPQVMRKPMTMQVEIDGHALPSSAWSVLVGNCGRIPGGITVLPDANVQDGKLNLMHVAPASLPGWFPLAWRGLRGTRKPVRGVIDRLGERVTIIPETPAIVQVDGDVWHDIHRVDVGIEPAALIVRGKGSPAHGSARHGEGDSQTYTRMDESER